MSSKPLPAPPPAFSAARERVKSFLGWAVVISIVLHAVTLPFFGLKARREVKQEVEKISVTKPIHVKPPTPTPPPPTPRPKQTPPPVNHTVPPRQPLRFNMVQTSKSASGPNETKYVARAQGGEDAKPLGTPASGLPEPAATIAATPAPVPAEPTPTPKPQCAIPNADAAIKGQAVEPDYPSISREQGAEGTVRVKVTLDANGNAVDFSIYKSSGNAALDQSALNAAKATHYTPQVVECEKTAGSYSFDADFTAQ